MRLHRIAVIGWSIGSVPIMIWFRESVAVVVAISLYTVIVTHAGADRGARAEQAIIDSPLTPDEE